MVHAIYKNKNLIRIFCTHLSCTHRIYEMMLHGVFSTVNLVNTSGPGIIILKHFKKIC